MLDKTSQGSAGTGALPFAIEPHPSPMDVNERARLLENPGFGRVFTDNMVTIRYSEAKGWHDARIQPRAPFSSMRRPPSSITRRKFSRA